MISSCSERKLPGLLGPKPYWPEEMVRPRRGVLGEEGPVMEGLVGVGPGRWGRWVVVVVEREK